jgi:hypothetical protein
MPTKGKGSAGSADLFQALNRAVIQLKVKVAADKREGSTRPSRDAVRAAGEVEACISSIEVGPTGLQLALGQVRAAA